MMMPTLHIRLLGDFNLIYDDRQVTSLNTMRLQSLLAYLVLHRDVPQHRQHLAFERPVMPAVLIGDAEVDDAAQIAGLVLVDVEEMARQAGPRSSTGSPASDHRSAADRRR